LLFQTLQKKSHMKTKSTCNVIVEIELQETILQSRISVLKIENSVEWKKISFNSFEYRTTLLFSHPGTWQCTTTAAATATAATTAASTHARQTKVASQLTHTPNYHLKCQGHLEDILKNTVLKE
jgi:hypothetical protein